MSVLNFFVLVKKKKIFAARKSLPSSYFMEIFCCFGNYVKHPFYVCIDNPMLCMKEENIRGLYFRRTKIVFIYK